MRSSNRMDQNPEGYFGVDNLERKVCNKTSSSSGRPRLSVQRKRRGELRSLFNLRTETSSKAVVQSFVIRRLREKLGTSFPSEPGLLHGAIRRASAKTSSAGSTPILRTLSLSPILGQRSVHVEAQALQP